MRDKETYNYKASIDYEVIIGKGRKLAVNIPTKQTGYTLSVNKTELTWKDSVEISFTLSKGYSKLDTFAVNVNGKPIELKDGKFTVENAENDVTITVTGVADTTAPTAEIILGENKWNKLLNKITFGLFFNKAQTVTITATDDGSGVDKVYYYLSATEIDADALSSVKWTEYTGAFNLNPNDKYIIYAKAVDKDNNTEYISSDGIVIDTIAPVISGIKDGETHYGDTTFTVTDKHINVVMVDGKPVTFTEVKYTIKADGKQHTVVAIDKAENSSAGIKITVITIASLDDTIESITADNVKSSDKVNIEKVQTFVNSLIGGSKTFTAIEQEQLNAIKTNTENLLKKITITADEIKAVTDGVNAYDKDHVKSDDRQDIENLIKRIDTLTATENVTDTEKSDLDNAKSTANALFDKIDEIIAMMSSLTDSVNGYDIDKVKSDDLKAINGIIATIDCLLDGDNLINSEKEKMTALKEKAETLVKRIEDVNSSTVTDNTDKVKDTTSDNVKTEDKKDLENAKQDLEKALTDYGDNLTENEKKEIQDKIDTIENALEVIKKVEKVQDLINNLPNDITKGNADAIKTANDIYNTLTEYEKSILDNNFKKKLYSAKTTLERLNLDTSTNSPKTEDIANVTCVVLLTVSGMLMFLFICLKKQTKIKKTN